MNYYVFATNSLYGYYNVKMFRLLTERLTRRYICEQQQAEDFQKRKCQVQTAEGTLGVFGGKTHFVEFEVGKCHQ